MHAKVRFFSFRPEIPFFGKFGPKNKKLSVKAETCYLV